MQESHSPLHKACIGLIQSLKAPASWHAVHGQTIVNRATGETSQCIVVHRHPINSAAEFKAKQLPTEFAGFPVIERPWPNTDL